MARSDHAHYTAADRYERRATRRRRIGTESKRQAILASLEG